MAASSKSMWRPAFAFLLVVGLSACAAGPDYVRPGAPTSPSFKESSAKDSLGKDSLDWAPAEPSDATGRGDWWSIFNDPVLSDLEQQVDVSNQNLKAFEAAYQQSQALVSEQRAALFPTLALTASAIKSGGSSLAGPAPYQLGAGASWAPDVWGGIRRTIEAARDSAQASQADLAGARLAAQTSLALDYILLRQLDEQTRLQDATVAAYQRLLAVVQNRYAAGATASSDVLSAQTQLAGAQGDQTDLIQQRAKLEHAIAILAGLPPAKLTIVPAAWMAQTAEIPAIVPSGLLQRRPDIAGAERRAGAANAQIGVATAAYFPSIALTGDGGVTSLALGRLFTAANSFWSIGASAGETVFDAGARSAKVKENRAAYDQAVANYRQTVLTAFGQVEDALVAQRVLAAEQIPRDAAVAAANRNERMSFNQYTAGQVDYTTVALAQVAAVSARTAALQNQASRLAASVDLINALGGGWTTNAGLSGSSSPTVAGKPSKVMTTQ